MHGVRPLRLLPPLLLAGAALAGAPFLGMVRDLLLQRFPRGALAAVTAGLGLAAAAALLFAVASIRQRRALRYAGLALCVGLLALQLVGFATGNVRVDVVERVHLLEYGLLAALFYRAFLPLGGPAVPLLAWLAGGLVGTLDEWVQWLVPTRVGEVGDVALNFAAAGTGTLFALCLAPLWGFAWRLSPRHRRAVAGLAAVTVLVLGGLYHVAHLGYAVHDEVARVTFRSWYSADELPRVAADRARRWQTRPPTLHPLTREDRYLTEATWRVSHRNASMERGERFAAWREQLILERHYAPVLARRGLASGEPLDLPAAERQRLQRAGRRGRQAFYRSPVLDHRIVLRPSKAQWWAAVALLSAGLLAAAVWPSRDGAQDRPDEHPSERTG